MTFKDHFSQVATGYARSRPGYPPELFDALAAVAPARKLAWDCATGNGQAALPLAERFERVVATDLSAEQLERAAQHPRIDYRMAPADRSGIAAGAVDLVTVAQAVHWFDFEAFYGEVRRVLRPRGVLALWTYHHLETDAPVLEVLLRFRARVGADWPPERRWVEELYATLPFPFDEIAVGPFFYEADWDAERLLGYLATWSATSAYRRRTGADAVAELRPELLAAWGDPERRRRLRWPIHLRVGRA